MAFIVDSQKFQAEGAILAWPVIARRLRMEVGSLPSVLQLRWMLHNELGLPSEPFIVWRRDRQLSGNKPITFTSFSTPLFGIGQLIAFDRPYGKITLRVSGPGGVVYGYVGPPLVRHVVAVAMIPSGTNRTVQLSAPSIEGLMLPSTSNIVSLNGTAVQDLTEADGWEKFEFVGLPVDKQEWAGTGIGAHGTNQGMIGSFTDAKSAAKDRLKRGSPPIGWATSIEPGILAPPWTAASTLVVDELQDPLLRDLRSIAAAPPEQQRLKLISKVMPPPENTLGQAVSQPGSNSNVSPLNLMLMAAGTDCYNSLALGFGTAYPIISQELSARDFDYMITARYEKGPTGVGPAVEYAALVPTPSNAIATPIPVDMISEKMGDIRPEITDRSWRATVRTSWEKPISMPLFRPRSFALASLGVTPPSGAKLKLNRRLDGSPHYVAINYFTNLVDPEANRVSAVERELSIPSVPGSRTLKHAVAHQDIYGQWSNWVTQSVTLAQPPVDDVRIVSAEFQYVQIPSAPQSVCTAELVIEFLWDWRIRTPLTISFRGRLFAASFHGQPPADTSVPSAMQTTLANPGGTTFTLRFDALAGNGGPTATWPGFDPLVHCIALDPSGENKVAFGAQQGPETRRYRVRIPGFSLDYAATGNIGLAVWAQGREAVAPQRIGQWSKLPLVVSTSDPRPPQVIPDLVTLTSLPDASGKAHARLSWSNSPGAVGYFVYESSESRLRARARDLGTGTTLEPDPNLTLSLRLTQLKQIFDGHAAEMRSIFTRVNSRLITGKETDITLPRGSTSIHVYVVQAVSAGQVEAIWPGTADSMFAFAVPRTPKPAPPTLEVRSFLDQVANRYRTRVLVATRPGPRVQRVELYRVRVDDAARELDTMGPPVATIDTNSPGWDVPHTNDALGDNIVTALGTDTPTESWKRVWYRAVAWSANDALRGTLAARSPASSTGWVVIPPINPPELSPLTLDWPGGALADVLVKWTSPAPIAKTPLGLHQLSIRAKKIGAAPDEPPLLSFEGPLEKIATAPPAVAPILWRTAGTPQQYSAILRRAAMDDAVEVTVRLIDPLGRSNESLITIKPGPILPDPELSDFTLDPTLNPPGRILKWSSSTPITPGVYTLKVTVSRPPFVFNGQIIPRPPLVQQFALSDLPLEELGLIPAGADPLRVRRLLGIGAIHSYYAFVRIQFTRITVQLSSPDGRIASHTEPG